MTSLSSSVSETGTFSSIILPTLYLYSSRILSYSSILGSNSLISEATFLDLLITSSRFPSFFACLNDLDNLFFSELKLFRFCHTQ